MPYRLSADGYAAMKGEVPVLVEKAAQAIVERAWTTVDAASIPVDTVIVDILRGRLFDRVAERVRESAADVMVLGTHGRRGVGSKLLGSDTEQIVCTATAPILLVRATSSLDGDQAASTGSLPVKMEPA